MPGPFGPYEQPGWPSTLPYFQPGKTFANAFATQQAVNLKTRQLENQLQQMALKNQYQEFLEGYKEQDFNRKVDNFKMMMGWRDHEQAMRDKVTELKVGQMQAGADQAGDMAAGFQSVFSDHPRGSPEVASAIWDVVRHNTAAARMYPKMVQDAWMTYEHDRSVQKGAFNHDETDFQRRFKDSLGAGQSTDMGILYNPQNLKTEYKDKEGKLHAQPTLDDKGKPVDEWAKDWTPSNTKDPQMYNEVPDASGDPNKVHRVTYPKSYWDEMIRQRKALDERKTSIGDPVDNQYTTTRSYDQLSPQDKRMLKWARDNPGSTYSAQVKARLGME